MKENKIDEDMQRVEKYTKMSEEQKQIVEEYKQMIAEYKQMEEKYRQREAEDRQNVEDCIRQAEILKCASERAKKLSDACRGWAEVNRKIAEGHNVAIEKKK